MDRSVYVRPNKPKKIFVKRRCDNSPPLNTGIIEMPIVVHVGTECHVTPAAVADRMASYIGYTGDGLVLEPSSGTGNLISALLDSGVLPDNLVAVERDYTLFNNLKTRFSGAKNIKLIHNCFFKMIDEYRGTFFSRIVMNPPFKNVRQHINAALNFLNDDKESLLIALVPITFKNNGAETLEELEINTFKHIKVNTKIIRYVR